jgi:protein-S-isoprenylcysteine O-methyltransferase Ste14
MVTTVILVAGSVPLVWFSRRSLLHPAAHGFPRFFAFEATLALIAINIPHWFVDPLGLRQLVSWFLLVTSIVPVVWGFVLLRRHGRSRPTAEGSPMFEWENTGQLVTTGVYRYIRHPMYSSLLFLAWGALLKAVSIGTLALAGIATLALVATARAEERENVVRFGREYEEYMKRSHRFVPFLL